jgi:pimeloyl-ACP methyl ester carboxylesterase
LASYEDRFWWSPDGLRLHYRDYPGPGDRPPLLCLPGLTRNARDFEPVAARFAGEWRLICADLRGRGESAYAKDSMSYVPLTYLQDLDKLIGELGIQRFVGIGTSLGGLMLMLLASTGHGRMAGAVLNDIGPELEESGLARIRANTGNGGHQPTWVHAARGLSELMGSVYPGFGLEQWLVLAKRMCRLNAQGRIVPDYDARIAEPLRLPGGATGIDLWPALDAFRAMPTLLLRGELSDLLSAATAERMRERVPALEVVTVPRVGHAPTLEEPEAMAAMERLFARVLESA